MKKLLHIIVVIAGVLCAQAYENTTLNVSAAGGRMSGSRYQSVGAIVPVGGQASLGGSLFHQSGFTSGFILQPETAFGVLPDELNPDNDSDGLSDGDEVLVGSNLWKSDTDDDGLPDYDEVRTHGTSPVLADTDADGMNDFRELVAGTSPTNENSFLSVSATLLPDGRQELSWFGVAGRFYTFQHCASLPEGDWQSYPFEMSGADGVLSLIDSESATKRFYRVRVRAPE